MNKHILGYGAAALALLIVLYLYHKNEVSVAVAAERIKSQDAVIQQAKDAIAAAERAREQVNADLEAERKKPATVKTVTKLLPVPLPQGSELKVEQLPDAPAPQVVLSGDAQKNLDFITSQLVDHQECNNNLGACQTELKKTQEIASANASERDTWKQTAKGGSKWHRALKALKVIGCAGGGAALGSLWKTRGAAIGGAAGAGACEVLF